MTQTDKTFSKIINNYNPEKNIKKQKIQQKKAQLIAEEKELKEAKILEAKKDKEEKKEEVQTSNYDTLDEVEKEFVNSFIEYNELMLLNDSNKKLIDCFTKSLGENAKAAIEELEKRTKEREQKVKELSKKLTDIKGKIVKETEKIKAKESLINLFNSTNITEPAPEKQTDGSQPNKKLDFPKNIVENKKKK